MRGWGEAIITPRQLQCMVLYYTTHADVEEFLLITIGISEVDCIISFIQYCSSPVILSTKHCSVHYHTSTIDCWSNITI